MCNGLLGSPEMLAPDLDLVIPGFALTPTPIISTEPTRHTAAVTLALWLPEKLRGTTHNQSFDEGDAALLRARLRDDASKGLGFRV